MIALFTTILDLPFVTLALFAWLFFVAILYFAYLLKNRRDYHAGFKAGRAEEVSYRNSIIIPKLLHACRQGAQAEKIRWLSGVGSKN